MTSSTMLQASTSWEPLLQKLGYLD